MCTGTVNTNANIQTLNFIITNYDTCPDNMLLIKKNVFDLLDHHSIRGRLMKSSWGGGGGAGVFEIVNFGREVCEVN